MTEAGFSVAVRWPSVGHAAAYVIEFKEVPSAVLMALMAGRLPNPVPSWTRLWALTDLTPCCRQAGSTQTERFVRAAAPTTPGTLVELRVRTPKKRG